jgi:hypothetical protein
VAVAVVVVVVAVFIGDLSDGPLFPRDRLERFHCVVVRRCT